MHNNAMRTHAEIIRTVGEEAVASLTASSIHTVRSWVQRDSLPARYWSALVEAGHATADELMSAAAAKRAA